MEFKNVTLVCIDCLNYMKAIRAILKSVEQIEFKEVLFLTDKSFSNPNFKTVIIDKIESKEEYSKFMITELGKYIETSHCLVIQYDGYVINPNLWTDEFLKYDYIGSPWWYDSDNVGNGGFSLRSKKLLEVLEYYIEEGIIDLNDIKTYHPEDDRICREYGSMLKHDAGINFAPEHIAAKFSFEPNNKYKEFKNNTFGFHGIGQLIL